MDATNLLARTGFELKQVVDENAYRLFDSSSWDVLG